MGFKVFWLAAVIALCAGEAATVGLVCIWFAAGALAAPAAGAAGALSAALANAHRAGAEAGAPLLYLFRRAGDVLFPASGSIHNDHFLYLGFPAKGRRYDLPPYYTEEREEKQS